MEQQLEVIPIAFIQDINEALELQAEHYPSHAEFGLDQMIQKLEDRRIWDETLGKRASELSLVQMVQNDIRFWHEQQKQKQ